MAMPGVSWEHPRTINYLGYNDFNDLCFDKNNTICVLGALQSSNCCNFY